MAVGVGADKFILLLFKLGRYPVAYSPEGGSLKAPDNTPTTSAGITPTEKSEMIRLLSVNVGLPRSVE
jgi:hypothetical protein